MNTVYYAMLLDSDVIIIIIINFNCKWVDTRGKKYRTQLHTDGTHNSVKGTHVPIKKKKKWEVRAVPRLSELYN
jgi:hypothetical protein